MGGSPSLESREMRTLSLGVLERCLALHGDADGDAKRGPRLDDLLAKFVSWQHKGVDLVFAKGWHFCVLDSFRAALDIQQTPRVVDSKSVMQWTQGSWFRFEIGDTVYDSPKAYLPWDLHNFDICLDVRRASPAQPPNGSDRRTRSPGTVIFDVLSPNKKRTELVTCHQKVLTQDEFVRLLISGPPPEWNEFLIHKKGSG